MKKKINDEVEADDLLHSLMVLRQSPAWKWYELQIKAFQEQIMGEWAESKENNESLKGEYKAYKRALNVLTKKIEDLTTTPPEEPNLDPYKNGNTNRSPIS